MLPAYFFACLFAPLFLLVASVASPGPAPAPFGVGFPRAFRKASALDREPVPQPAEPEPPLVTAQSDEFEVDVLPFVLISTIDGALHAVDRDSGNVRWSLRDGVEPLVGGGTYGKPDPEEYIVEPLSGNLYVFEGVRGNPKVRKLPLTVEELIDYGSFTTPQQPSRSFTGSKQTSLLTLDLRTGQQLDCFSSHKPLDPGVCENDFLDDLEGRARAKHDTLYVGRTDYRLVIRTGPSDAFPPVLPNTATSSIQEITYSTYTPNSFDRDLAAYWARTGGGQTANKRKRTRIELVFDGSYAGVQDEEGGGQVWFKPVGHGGLSSVGVAVYDVVLPLSASSPHPVILPQPKAEVAFASLDDGTRAPPVYIGSVPFAPALAPAPSGDDPTEPDDENEPRQPVTRPLMFVQSSNSYPFVHAARPARPGTVNGSFLLAEDLPDSHVYLPQIDPPKEPTNAVDTALPSSHSEMELGAGVPGTSGTQWALIGAAELAALVLCCVGVYHWGFKKATALAASGKPVMDGTEKAALLDTPPPADPNGTPVVRFQALPDVAASDPATPTPEKKKKTTRRRVRGRKKRRNSVGPRDEGEGEGDDDDDDKGDHSSTPSEDRKSTERTLLDKSEKSDLVDTKLDKLEKPLPELPRTTSAVTLMGEHETERLSISDTVIGFGSHGTVVLKGTWGGRPVAVKRLLSDFVRLASQEVKLLQASDDHPNVIRYYCQERRDNFLYIALDLCQASLADLIEAPDRHMELAVSLEPKRALQQITAGLKHLHGMKIIHRDIKPQNVLVSRANDGALRMLVSDFGLARRLEQGQSSFAPTANNLAGSLGWRAPECIRGQVKLNEGFDPVLSCGSTGSTASSTGSLTDLIILDDGERRLPSARLTKAVDLFALGCLYFWVLMNGEHPFGETYNRESNIVKGDAVNMDNLSILGEEGIEAQHLIGRLLSAEPSERPDTAECLIHPYFWTPAKRLSFLCDASDRFEIMETDPPESTLVMLEKDAHTVVTRDWYSRMDRVFTASLGKYRKYKGNAVRDLLRAMRNKKHHYQDLEPSAQKHFGALPAGFLHYFTSRFPRLFLHVYSVVRDSRLRRESMFEVYFQE